MVALSGYCPVCYDSMLASFPGPTHSGRGLGVRLGTKHEVWVASQQTGTAFIRCWDVRLRSSRCSKDDLIQVIPPPHPRHLGSQLAELERVIERMMEADFVSFAMEDIQQRLQSASEAAPSNPERTDSEVGCTRCSLLCYTVVYGGQTPWWSSIRYSAL